MFLNLSHLIALETALLQTYADFNQDIQYVFREKIIFTHYQYSNECF